MKKQLLMLFVALAVLPAMAQTSYSFNADVVSRYIWRGIEYGANSMHVQPYGAISHTFGGSHTLSVGFWASYAMNNNYTENDLFLSYSLASEKAGTFGLTISDYYYPYQGLDAAGNDLGSWANVKDKGEGAHTFEVAASYQLPASFPLKALVSTNFYNDAPDNKSLYVELSYPFTLGEEISGTVFSGAAQGKSVWHAVATDKFEVINTGFSLSKAIKITESYSLPVGVSYVYNSFSKRTFVVFKVTF